MTKELAGEYHSLESLSLVTIFSSTQIESVFGTNFLLQCMIEKGWEGLGCVVVIFDLESELLQNYYREAQKKQPEQAAELAAGEVFPSNLVVTLRKEEENILTPEIMKWGFTGFKKDN